MTYIHAEKIEGYYFQTLNFRDFLLELCRGTQIKEVYVLLLEKMWGAWEII